MGIGAGILIHDSAAGEFGGTIGEAAAARDAVAAIGLIIDAAGDARES